MVRSLETIALALVLLLVAAAAPAQEPASGWNPRTGDAWVDAALQDIDRYAQRYPDAFVDELVRYHATPRELADALLAQRRWSPGDLYFACALARVSGQPCRAVVDSRDAERAHGWGVVEQRFGASPESEAFGRLKRGIVASYARWARPLPKTPPPAVRPTRGDATTGAATHAPAKPRQPGTAR